MQGSCSFIATFKIWTFYPKVRITTFKDEKEAIISSNIQVPVLFVAVVLILWETSLQNRWWGMPRFGSLLLSTEVENGNMGIEKLYSTLTVW